MLVSRRGDRWTDEAASAWTAWLRTRKWDWWFTGTLARPVSEATAASIMEQALGRWRADAPKLYAVWAVERGGNLGRTHVHALIGGVGTHPRWGRRFITEWTVGQVRCERYDPAQDVPGTRRGAVPYLEAHTGVQITGTLRKHRPRR